MTKDGQDAQELSDVSEDVPRARTADESPEKAQDSEEVKEELHHEDGQEGQERTQRKAVEECGRGGEEFPEKGECEESKKHLVDRREVEVIGITPENSEEQKEMMMAGTHEGKEEVEAAEEVGNKVAGEVRSVEDKKAEETGKVDVIEEAEGKPVEEVSKEAGEEVEGKHVEEAGKEAGEEVEGKNIEEEESASQPGDINANIEMPAIAKDQSQVTREGESPGRMGSVPAGQDDDRTDPALPKVTRKTGYVDAGPGTREPGKKLNGAVPPSLQHTMEKIGWNGRKGADDPHGVQEILDGFWREDSQILRANYPTTTAYRVAIKKKRSSATGNALLLLFFTILMLVVVSGLIIYLVRTLPGPLTNLPDGKVQTAHPTSNGESLTAGAEKAAPASNGRVLAGYQWIQGGTKHELYIAANNHIQELSTSDENTWEITDLTKRSGAALANGRTLAGFEWQHGDSEQIVYIDAKRHIQQLTSLNGEQWDVVDLTRKARAPLANGNSITGYEWSQSKQVAYVDQRGHVQELASSDGNTWHTSDLTALTKAPPASGNVLAAYQWEKVGSKQVDYISTNQHVHELSFIAGSWQDTDLNSLVGAPLANGRTLVGYQWRQNGTSQIGYLDTNNHIQLLSSANPGNWNLVDLTQLVKAPIANGNALVGYAWQQGGCNVLYFIDGSNHIQEMSDAPGENWQLSDLNQFTLTAPPPNGKVLFGYDWAQHSSKQVVYIDTTNTVRELTSSNIPGKWDMSSWKQS